MLVRMFAVYHFLSGGKVSCVPFNVFPVILHDYIDKVIDGSYSVRIEISDLPETGETQEVEILIIDHTVFISNQHFAVEKFVISKNVGDHLFIDVLRWRLESDLHATGFLGL